MTVPCLSLEIVANPTSPVLLCALQELSLIDDLREIDGDFKQVQQQSDDGLASALQSLDEIVRRHGRLCVSQHPWRVGVWVERDWQWPLVCGRAVAGVNVLTIGGACVCVCRWTVRVSVLRRRVSG